MRGDVEKDGASCVGRGRGTHPAMSCSRRIFPWDSLVLESGGWEVGGVGICLGRDEAAG